MRYDYNLRGLLRGAALACIAFAVLILGAWLVLKHVLPDLGPLLAFSGIFRGFGL